jgi:hypothetical protein
MMVVVSFQVLQVKMSAVSCSEESLYHSSYLGNILWLRGSFIASIAPSIASGSVVNWIQYYIYVCIVTNGSVVWLINTWVLDWTLDLLDRPLAPLMITICSGAIASSHSYSLYSSVTITNSLSVFLSREFTIHVLSPLDLLSLTSPRVPASNGRRSSSWIIKLSLFHSHSNFWLTLHSAGTLLDCQLHCTHIFWSSLDN